MSEFLKCVDPDAPNKFVLIRDGDIVFYEDINGNPTPVTSITQVNSYNVESGTAFTLPERYRVAPDVYVMPQQIRTFDAGGVFMDQELDIANPSITAGAASGQYAITITGGLKSSGSSYMAVAPTGAYRSNEENGNPTWAVPVAGIKEAVVYARISGYWATIRSSSSQSAYGYGMHYTFRAGIGEYQAGPDYWGANVTGDFTDTSTHIISCSVSGNAGNYLHIAANLSSNSTHVTSAELLDLYEDDAPVMWLLGARCRGGGDWISDNTVFTAVCVGR